MFDGAIRNQLHEHLFFLKILPFLINQMHRGKIEKKTLTLIVQIPCLNPHILKISVTRLVRSKKDFESYFRVLRWAYGEENTEINGGVV